MRSRNIYLGIGLTSLSAVCLAVYLQEAWQLSACTWCVLQRYIYLALAVFSFLCALRPGHKTWLVVLTGLVALSGIAAAARNTWVLYVPSFTCGRDKLAAAVNALPTAEAWPLVFEANGLCSDSSAALAGIPFPIVSGLVFTALLLALLAAYRMTARDRAAAE